MPKHATSRDVYVRSLMPMLQGRLLHYFPPDEAGGGGSEDWCAWHKDHGSITGDHPCEDQKPAT